MNTNPPPHANEGTITKGVVLLMTASKALAAAAAAVFAMAILLPAGSRAATITWGTPTAASVASNVDTTNLLVYAYNFGDSGVPSVSLNGVTFAPFAVPASPSTSATVGNVNLSIVSGDSFTQTNGFCGAPGSAPYSSLPSAYQTLLQSGVSNNFPNGAITLNLGGLTVGNPYRLQIWTNDSQGYMTSWPSHGDPTVNALVTFNAVNTATLDVNSTNNVGGVGQWVIGTFTANSTVQAVTISTPGNVINSYPLINAMQLRSTSVPEPGTASLLGLGALSYAGFRRRRV